MKNIVFFRARYDRCEIPNDSPGISTEDETLPTAHTAGITADTVLPPVYETTTPASIPTPTASVATTDDVSYLHDYHDAILAADSADYRRRATTACVRIPHLGPRIWKNSTISNTAIQMDRTYFQKADLSTLSSDDASSIHQWYRQLVQQATSANIDLCPLRSFDSLQALWPSNTVPNLVIEMAQALLTKIDPCIDKTNSVLGLIYAQEITNSDSKLAAYYFLHAILRHADLEFIDKIEPLPVFNMFRDPIKFAHALLHFQTSNSRHQRTYTDRAISQHFLMDLVANDFTLHTQYQQLRDLPTTSLLPESLLYTNIALTLASTTPNVFSIDIQSPLPIAHRNE